MEKNCEHCGKLFKFPAYRAESAKYCSRSCTALSMRTHTTSNCQVCGKQFDHISSRCNSAKYCSRECYYQSLKGSGSKKFTCAHCGLDFFDSPSKKRKFCSKSCINKSTKKNWKASFTTVRKMLLRRGMIERCERCGYDEHKQILGVHHKDRNRANNELENLEILCPNCHSIEHMKHTPHGFKE